MKQLRYIGALLLTLVVGLVASSCKRDVYEEPTSSFQVVRTVFSSSNQASEGYIEVTESGFTYEAEADWVTLSQETPTRVKLAMAENPEPETRTTSIVLRKGATTLRVSVNQVGVINTAVLENQEFTETGGTFEVSTAQLVSTPMVEISHSWITYEIQEGKLVFTVAPFPTPGERVATVTIRAGLYAGTLTVRQVRGAILYSELLGAYTLYYRVFNNVDPEYSTPVTLVQDVEGRSVLMRGLAADVRLNYDVNTGNFKLSPQSVADGAAKLYLWAAEDPGPFNESPELFLTGTWNQQISNPVYTFTSTQTIRYQEKDYQLSGFIFWGDKEYKGPSGTGISRVVQFRLVKN